jgi:RNA polymerase sigma-32 factor
VAGKQRQQLPTAGTRAAGGRVAGKASRAARPAPTEIEAQGETVEGDDSPDARHEDDELESDDHVAELASDPEAPFAGAAGDDALVEVEGELLAADDAGFHPAEEPSSSTALERYDPLQSYMREVQRHPLLDAEEEHAIAVHYSKTQDVAAAARLVTSNLRLVVKIAYEYRRAYRNMMDLVQEGNIGLMQAVKRYDPYRGVKLSSYAAWWIRAYMLRYILNNWRMVKIGTTQAQRKLFFNLNKEKARLSAMGIEPSHAEIAKSLQVEEREVIEMDRRLSAGDASLDAPMGDSDGRTTSRLELLPGTAAGPEAVTQSAELGVALLERLARFRTTLQGKELVIFDQRVDTDEPKTLQELGDEFGISRERVRQLEARMMGRLRDFLREELGDAVAFEH